MTLIPFLVLATAASFGGDHCEPAMKVVERYIALDLQGEGTRSSSRMDELIDYQGRDTPGWDSFMLTDESRIRGCTKSGDHAVITISHRVFGSVVPSEPTALDAILAKPPREEVTSLRLNRTPHGWKIDSPKIYVPHVGVAAARKMLR